MSQGLVSKPWTVERLYDALQVDLRSCHTVLERQCCEAICGKEIRELAETLAKTRSLTHTERAIVRRYGFREVNEGARS